MPLVLDCPWQWCAPVCNQRRDVRATQQSARSLIALLQLFCRVSQGGWTKGDSHSLVGAGSRQRVRVGNSSCLPPAVSYRHGLGLVLLPALLAASTQVYLLGWKVLALAGCSKYFPLPLECTKAGCQCAHSPWCILKKKKKAGYFAHISYFLIFGTSNSSAIHGMERMKKSAKVVINRRTKSQSPDWRNGSRGWMSGWPGTLGRGSRLPDLVTPPCLFSFLVSMCLLSNLKLQKDPHG